MSAGRVRAGRGLGLLTAAVSGWLAVLPMTAPPRAATAASDPVTETGTPPDGTPAAEPADGLPDVLSGIPEAVFNEHLTIAECEDPASEHMRDRSPVIGQVSPVATLYAIPCVAGANDTSYRLYLHETGEIGGVHPVYFAVWSDGHAWIGTELLRSVRFDAETGVLTGESAGTAGAGPSAACRVRGTWVWNRWAFALKRMETVGCAASVPAVIFP